MSFLNNMQRWYVDKDYAGGDNGEAGGGSEWWRSLLLASRSLTKMYRFIIMPQNYHFRASTGNNHN